MTMGERVVFLSVVYGVLDTRFVVFTKYKYISEERRNKNNAPSWTLPFYHLMFLDITTVRLLAVGLMLRLGRRTML